MKLSGKNPCNGLRQDSVKIVVYFFLQKNYNGLIYREFNTDSEYTYTKK